MSPKQTTFKVSIILIRHRFLWIDTSSDINSLNTYRGAPTIGAKEMWEDARSLFIFYISGGEVRPMDYHSVLQSQ